MYISNKRYEAVIKGCNQLIFQKQTKAKTFYKRGLKDTRETVEHKIKN